jgi:hypothetical protein
MFIGFFGGSVAPLRSALPPPGRPGRGRTEQLQSVAFLAGTKIFSRQDRILST